MRLYRVESDSNVGLGLALLLLAVGALGTGLWLSQVGVLLMALAFPWWWTPVMVWMSPVHMFQLRDARPTAEADPDDTDEQPTDDTDDTDDTDSEEVRSGVWVDDVRVDCVLGWGRGRSGYWARVRLAGRDVESGVTLETLEHLRRLPGADRLDPTLDGVTSSLPRDRRIGEVDDVQPGLVGSSMITAVPLAVSAAYAHGSLVLGLFSALAMVASVVVMWVPLQRVIDPENQTRLQVTTAGRFVELDGVRHQLVQPPDPPVPSLQGARMLLHTADDEVVVLEGHGPTLDALYEHFCRLDFGGQEDVPVALRNARRNAQGTAPS